MISRPKKHDQYQDCNSNAESSGSKLPLETSLGWSVCDVFDSSQPCRRRLNVVCGTLHANEKDDLRSALNTSAQVANRTVGGSTIERFVYECCQFCLIKAAVRTEPPAGLSGDDQVPNGHQMPLSGLHGSCLGFSAQRDRFIQISSQPVNGLAHQTICGLSIFERQN